MSVLKCLRQPGVQNVGLYGDCLFAMSVIFLSVFVSYVKKKFFLFMHQMLREKFFVLPVGGVIIGISLKVPRIMIFPNHFLSSLKSCRKKLRYRAFSFIIKRLWIAITIT